MSMAGRKSIGAIRYQLAAGGSTTISHAEQKPISTVIADYG
jgi:hypothetical protein